jgi:hypothetical protein
VSTFKTCTVKAKSDREAKVLARKLMEKHGTIKSIHIEESTPIKASVETAAKPKLSKTFKTLEKVMQELGYATSQKFTLLNPGYPVTAWE